MEMTRNDPRITTGPGDVILRRGDQITVANSWGFTRLAGADDPSGLREKPGDGSISATFSLEWEVYSK